MSVRRSPGSELLAELASLMCQDAAAPRMVGRGGRRRGGRSPSEAELLAEVAALMSEASAPAWRATLQLRRPESPLTNALRSAGPPPLPGAEK